MTSQPAITDARLQKLANNLLSLADFDGEGTLYPLQGGRNNRVYRLESSAGVFLFKEYFHTSEDTRDRLGHEYRLLEYLHSAGSSYAARPHAADPGSHVALMEFIEGSRIEMADVNEPHIDHAIGFFLDLNKNRFDPAGLALPSASEACFSLSEHVATTQRRVSRLENISGELDVDREAQKFAQEGVVPFWNEVCRRIESAVAGGFADEALPLSERCLSPSDFGFHNALQLADGSVKFVDFEYAGWDDPAKLIADFANQPDMTPDRKHSDRFALAVIESNADPKKLRVRVGLLEPLYQIKWACICLNDFLNIGKSRRDFTGEEGRAKETARKTFQLQRAEKMLDRARETVRANGR